MYAVSVIMAKKEGKSLLQSIYKVLVYTNIFFPVEPLSAFVN